jgi:succinate dehydrogenase/fumarate reductase flavoprotein subunit
MVWTLSTSIEMDRRTLIKGSLAGAAVAASSGTALAGAGQQWNLEYDVVVVGSGSGLVSALVATVAGLRVLVLEKSAAPGGSTAVSGGVFWVPNNNVMKREGFSDSRENALRYLRKLSQGQADEELIAAFVDHGPAMADFVEANTELQLRVSRLMGDVADYHPEWPGAVLKGRSLEPVQPAVAMAGGLLVSSLLQALAARGADVMLGTGAQRLITATGEGGDQEVLGVLTDSGLKIRSKRGLVMASGGFERSPQMKKHFLRGPSPYTLGAQTNTGDGIRMGMAVGADLRNMNEVWGITVYKADAQANGAVTGGISLAAQVERRNGGCIAVNRYGERFCNEAADYDSTWRSYHAWENWGDLAYRNLPAFQLFDHSYREKETLAGSRPDQPLPEWVARADTLEELAGMLGIDPVGLARTVERFNAFAVQKRDPDFMRGQSLYDTYGIRDAAVTLQPLLKAPFYGAEITPADLGTCGGLRVNAAAQVMDVFDRPVKRLFAAGNVAGVGSPGALYGGGGGTIGPAMTFAYIAGMSLTG